MEMKPKVDILLGTYNGEKYLPDLLKSLEKQTFKDWRLIIRDDGSQDRTFDIIKSFERKYPQKVFTIIDNDKNLGACKNFLRLLEFSQGDYILFCDQDDYWLPEKIQKMIDKAIEVKEKFNSIPFLIHCDLKVVDENLEEIAPSFWKYQFIKPDYCKTLPKLLVTNSVTGCATLINRELKNLILPAPDGIIMHDWWCAIVASAFGKIFWMPESLVLYRQHGRNDVGAKEWNLSYIIKKALSFYERESLLKGFNLTIQQANVFYNKYRDVLNPEHKKLVEAYINLPKEGFIKKRLSILKHGFLRTGLIRNLGFLLRI